MDIDGQALRAIGGRVPPLDDMPAGCRFAPRCAMAQAGCERPQALASVGDGHMARCHVASGGLVHA
jgi:oligopeptide/dipeptide ABC transporter ATP-binding protein